MLRTVQLLLFIILIYKQWYKAASNTYASNITNQVVRKRRMEGEYGKKNSNKEQILVCESEIITAIIGEAV